MYIRNGYFNNCGSVIVIRKEYYKKLKSFSEENLFKLAKCFDPDFYTNDGYSVSINHNQFSFDYDDGYMEIDIERI